MARNNAGTTRTRAVPGVLADPVGAQPAGVSDEDTEAVFRSLYAEHDPPLLRLATTLTSGDRGRAEDLVQETMLRAWTHRDNLDIRHRSPQPWLITVARHCAVDAHRARSSRPPETELDENLEVGDRHLTDASVDEAGLRAAIATLPGAQRQALTEVYYRDRSAAETARMLQIPVGTVRSRICYGLRALRRTLAARDAVA